MSTTAQTSGGRGGPGGRERAEQESDATKVAITAPSVEEDRRRRIAANERLLHSANERIARVAEELQSESPFAAGPTMFFCACGRRSCSATIDLRVDEYERIHHDPHRFIVVPGHQQPEIERVVKRTDDYYVVEKLLPYRGESDG